MEQAIAEAFKWGGWPAVFLVCAIAFAKWYCTKKLEQDAKFHAELMNQKRASDHVLEALVNAVLGVLYKEMGNEEAVRAMADISKQSLESARASTKATESR